MICRTHARCSQINFLIWQLCILCDRVSLCRVGSANGNPFGLQLATRFRQRTLENRYTWVMIPQITSESSAWLTFLRWYRVLKTKIVPPNMNDLKKQFRHRDRHGKQVESMIRQFGNYLEPRVRHPSGREQRHHCLTQDVGAFFYPPRAAHSLS